MLYCLIFSMVKSQVESDTFNSGLHNICGTYQFQDARARIAYPSAIFKPFFEKTITALENDIISKHMYGRKKIKTAVD
uniref:Uncharacterized protein n=1 Tax=Anguilla anguilla TaxID=7936 RepID=A0A0E9S4R3_ANGAN